MNLYYISQSYSKYDTGTVFRESQERQSYAITQTLNLA